MLPDLTKSEQDRFDLISSTFEQFYKVKNITWSKMFLKSFAFDSKDMASSGGDNAEKKNTNDVAHVTTDEGESHHSLGDPSREDSVEYVGTIKKGQRGT